MKDTPPWWWKLGWTLAEATPKPKPLMTPGSLSGSLKEKTASKTAAILPPDKKRGCETENVPKPKGFWPSKIKKGGW